MFRHPAWVVGSYSSGPPAARTDRTKSTGGFNHPDGSPCTLIVSNGQVWTWGEQMTDSKSGGCSWANSITHRRKLGPNFESAGHYHCIGPEVITSQRLHETGWKKIALTCLLWVNKPQINYPFSRNPRKVIISGPVWIVNVSSLQSTYQWISEGKLMPTTN